MNCIASPSPFRPLYSPLTEAVNGQENNQKPVLRACFSFWGLCINYVMSLSPG